MSDLTSAVVAAAEQALAPTLGPVELVTGPRLESSRRAVVVRAVARDAAGREHAVVLKSAVADGEESARERAALRLAARYRLPGVVRLLAVSTDPPVLVLTDLGRRPTLADRLLGDDPSAARAAVLGWAGTLGTLQAASGGLREQFGEQLTQGSTAAAPPVDTSARALDGAARDLPGQLSWLDVRPSPAAVDELRGITEDLDVSARPELGGLVPGDTCPSNALEVDRGMALLDFEGAEYRHLAWEAAYLTVPWPTCWCSWRLPDGLVRDALRRWRQTVATSRPAVATAAFEDDLARATVAWAFLSVGWFLRAALDGDPPPPDASRAALVPRRRALLQHRLRTAAALDTAVLPALRHLAEQVERASVRAWGMQRLPLAPAFR